MAKGTGSPGELARQIGKSKYAVSVQLAALKRVGFVKASNVLGADMRRRSYDIMWAKVGEVFRQDHALELEIYENQLSLATLDEMHGKITRVGLAISGNGKLGLVREIIPEDPHATEIRQVGSEINQLIWEFVEFFRGYMKERRFDTMHEYFLGAYEELAEHHSRLPKDSGLGAFFEFIERAFTKITPVERIWKEYVPKEHTTRPLLYRETPREEVVVKLFAEAGSADPSGRYVLNAEAQAAIKPGTPLKIYPAYTYS
jgi:DNA-binding transcriptional ArsR family regulator